MARLPVWGIRQAAGRRRRWQRGGGCKPGFILELRHGGPIALGHVAHSKAGIFPLLDGNGVVKTLPQEAVTGLRLIGRTHLKLSQRVDGCFPRDVEQRFFVGAVIEEEALIVKAGAKVPTQHGEDPVLWLDLPAQYASQVGKAYKALLDAKNRNGQRNAALETFGDNRQSYNARKLVAEFFGVTEYEIRKAVKLTQLIPELSDILENSPKQLNLACADLIADYDAESQKAFIEIWSIEGYQINKAAMQHIVRKCPPPAADSQAVFSAWREARTMAEKRMAAPPKKISFDRRQLAPYLDKFSSDKEIEKLFLEFLQERAKVS